MTYFNTYIAEYNTRLTEYQRSEQQASARYEALQQLLQRRQSHLSEAARQWLQQHNARPLREALEVEPRWRGAIETLVKPWLESFWVDAEPSQRVPEGVSLLWPASTVNAPQQPANSATAPMPAPQVSAANPSSANAPPP